MPAHLEKNIGSISYEICSKKRKNARLLLSISSLNFFIYNIIPINIWPLNSHIFNHYGIPDYVTSSLVSLIPLIPGILVFILGRKVLGKESESPKKFRKIVDIGIYSKVRHPQLLGELLLFYFISFFMNSIFLLFFTSIFWVPAYLTWCHFEEKDLLLRYGFTYEEYKKRTKKLIPFIF